MKFRPGSTRFLRNHPPRPSMKMCREHSLCGSGKFGYPVPEKAVTKMLECFYAEKNSCGGGYTEPTPPDGWSEVTCALCDKVLGYACPACSTKEVCLNECPKEQKCWNPIPPPLPTSPRDAAAADTMRRILLGQLPQQPVEPPPLVPEPPPSPDKQPPSASPDQTPPPATPSGGGDQPTQ